MDDGTALRNAYSRKEYSVAFRDSSNDSLIEFESMINCANSVRYAECIYKDYRGSFESFLASTDGNFVNLHYDSDHDC